MVKSGLNFQSMKRQLLLRLVVIFCFINIISNQNLRGILYMQNYVKVGDIQVSKVLYDFVNSDVLPGIEVNGEKFWADFDKVIHEFAPENKALLDERVRLQHEINAWHKENKGSTDLQAYKTFLEGIGYLEPKPADFKVSTTNVDNEVAVQAGPQLVVPIDNARYALNAANARWGSLYDALYGTDVIGDEDGAEGGKGYNPVRGAKVITFAKNFLDNSAALAERVTYRRYKVCSCRREISCYT